MTAAGYFCVWMIGVAVCATASFAGGDWNDSGIAWQPYEKGIAEAKAEKKPICMVFYTEWCPHCTNYSKVFHDPKVVEQSKSFVMIRLDKDQNKELSKQFAPDGEYIPRTYFLSADGKLDPSIHAPRDKYQYFYDEKSPASILAGMESALKKLN
jgi:protein-disulfide reductase (glutathione)